MKIALGLNFNESPQELVKKGRLAESLRLDMVWIGDLPNERYAPAMAALLAEQTTKIGIGLGLISPLLHKEEHIASSLCTLTDLYGERFELLIGPGDRERLRSVGIEYVKHMPTRLTNALQEIRDNLEKHNIRCKIFLGAQGPRMLKASRSFDGVLVNLSNIEMVKWALRHIGSVKEDFEIGVFAPSYIYSNPNSRIEGLALMAAAVVARGASREVMEQARLSRDIAGRNRLDREHSQ